MKLILRLPDTLKEHYLPVAFLKIVASENKKQRGSYQELIDAMDSIQKNLPGEFYPQQPNLSDMFKMQSYSVFHFHH